MIFKGKSSLMKISAERGIVGVPAFACRISSLSDKAEAQ
jgi:hypothetical protein